VPCGPINDIEQVFADPQVKARGLQIAIPETDRAAEDGGTAQPGVASPIHFSETPIEYGLPPPRLGQHTDEVLLEELGMDAGELERLRASGVIGG
jgi:crotonobetainyl-CoA:carnitine CoA-transferase CaiB-like acyl-CoA transferase